MRTDKQRQLAEKRREAAVRRLHRREANEQLERYGIPKAVTMRKLKRQAISSLAASLGFQQSRTRSTW